MKEVHFQLAQENRKLAKPFDRENDDDEEKKNAAMNVRKFLIPSPFSIWYSQSHPSQEPPSLYLHLHKYSVILKCKLRAMVIFTETSSSSLLFLMREILLL